LRKAKGEGRRKSFGNWKGSKESRYLLILFLQPIIPPLHIYYLLVFQIFISMVVTVLSIWEIGDKNIKMKPSINSRSGESDKKSEILTPTSK
jgi:hypothetical protein